MTETTEEKRLPPLAKLAVDLGPLLIFFFANSQYGIMFATGAFMVATTISLAITYTVEQRLAPMPLVTGVLVMVFGGLTLYLDDELFIKLKPTIVNMIFATVLIAGLSFGRLFIKLLFGEVIQLPDHAWRTLTIRWAAFFIFLAVLNEVVWRMFSTDFWVAFKVWGVFPITLVFTALQLPFMTKHQIEEEEEPTKPADGAETPATGVGALSIQNKSDPTQPNSDDPTDS